MKIDAASYAPKTPFWAHQARDFPRAVASPAFFLQYEQRCGKTKIVIDKAALLFEAGAIDALVVVAMPSGVPKNWETDEIPAHMPDRVARLCLTWSSGRARTKSFRARLDLLVSFKGLAVLLVNGEAVTTGPFKEFIARFLAARRTFLVGDETTLIMKTPGIARTRAMHALGRHKNVLHKMILDGTPVGEGPFDLYAQVMFLSPKIFGFTSFFAFKNRYGVWEKGYSRDREYPVLKEYRNLDELYDRLAPHAARVTRREAFPNMPAKVYQKVRFELSDEQRRVYDELSETYEAELAAVGYVTAAHVLTRLMRLQQVASGFWPAEDVAAYCGVCSGEGCPGCDGLGVVVKRREATPIGRTNPRLDALADQFSRDHDPGIVWCRFSHDVDVVMSLCASSGRSAVRFDGSCSADEKEAARTGFQKGLYQNLVGTPRSGGRGLKLSAARSIYYYSNEYSLLNRLQSEDRAEDALATTGTSVLDLIAEDTNDERTTDALRDKRRVVDMVMRERSGPWL